MRLLVPWLRRPALGAVAVGVVSAPAAAQTFVALGTYPGSFETLPRGASAGGAVVVGQAFGAGNVPWRWTSGTGIQSMGWTGYAFTVSENGLVAAGVSGATLPEEAVRWTLATGPQGMGYLSPTHNSSSAWAASADGAVIVGRSGQASPAQYEAFRWSAGTGMQGLGWLPGHTSSWAQGVSADGTVVVGRSLIWPGGALSSEGFRWTQATGMVGLGFLSGQNRSVATAVSADGRVIGGGSYTSGVPGGQVVRWAPGGGIEPLGALPGTTSGCDCSAVSGDGSVVVGHCYLSGGATQAFLWTAGGGMRSLADVLTSDYGMNLAGWQLTTAFTISADGRAIAGSGRFMGGASQAYLAVLPAPCYPNCDASTAPPILNINDFVCFQQKFAAGDSYANCDNSTAAPVLNVNDFTCFLNKFAGGCP